MYIVYNYSEVNGEREAKRGDMSLLVFRVMDLTVLPSGNDCGKYSSDTET